MQTNETEQVVVSVFGNDLMESCFSGG